jgi:hypothetical protein
MNPLERTATRYPSFTIASFDQQHNLKEMAAEEVHKNATRSDRFLGAARCDKSCRFQSMTTATKRDAEFRRHRGVDTPAVGNLFRYAACGIASWPRSSAAY